MGRPNQKRHCVDERNRIQIFQGCSAGGGHICGTLSTLMVCLLLEKHRRHVGCDKDDSCLQKYMPRMVEVYTYHILNKSSDLVGHNQPKDYAHVYGDEMRSGRLRNSLDSLVHHLVCCLFRLLRGMWCHSCALCIVTIPCFILRTIYFMLTARRCG